MWVNANNWTPQAHAKQIALEMLQDSAIQNTHLTSTQVRIQILDAVHVEVRDEDLYGPFVMDHSRGNAWEDRGYGGLMESVVMLL
ncbi:hypothetical protein GE061_011283 [Apolygus lucorum]|uniref:Uncharacterized protein n=1 Tax=Apolygus lucorum TaxID=248454 RepID=A0A8S9XXA9_APOLU|nr:hypothetical protein GE061_011283 [Apolygus lucorum]